MKKCKSCKAEFKAPKVALSIQKEACPECVDSIVKRTLGFLNK